MNENIVSKILSFFNFFKKVINPDFTTTLENLEKEQAKILKKGKKLLLRDMGIEGRGWIFYLAKPDGTYTDAMTYDEVKPIYDSLTQLTPEVANAIVVTNDGYLNRKGLQDFYCQGVKFEKSDMIVLPPWRIPLEDPEAEERATTKPTPPEEVQSNSEKESDTGDSSEPSEHFDIEDGILFRYTGGRKTVKIPDGVKRIGPRAFESHKWVEKVIIPSGVESIGEMAFRFCSNLRSIEIPNSVTCIEKEAFYWCRELSSVILPNSITCIEESVFDGCEYLSRITIPDSVTSLGKYAFNNCSGLRSVDLPEKLEIIGKGAFGDCKKLSSITIPKNVKHVDGSAFSCCGNLNVIYYPGTEEQAKQIGLMNQGVFVRFNWKK